LLRRQAQGPARGDGPRRRPQAAPVATRRLSAIEPCMRGRTSAMHENKRPRPPAPNDIRLRKILDDTLTLPHWPEGFVMRPFEHRDAQALHALLQDVFDDGADGPFDDWWPRVAGDAEFDP